MAGNRKPFLRTDIVKHMYYRPRGLVWGAAVEGFQRIGFEEGRKDATGNY